MNPDPYANAWPFMHLPNTNYNYIVGDVGNALTQWAQAAEGVTESLKKLVPQYEKKSISWGAPTVKPMPEHAFIDLQTSTIERCTCLIGHDHEFIEQQVEDSGGCITVMPTLKSPW